MNNTLENTVKQTKATFSDYFDTVGGKKFKQFYYDWHINNMLAPFAELVKYFDDEYGKEGAEKFHEFVEELCAKIEIYNTDKPHLSVLKNSKFSKSKDGKLSGLIDGVETFGFEFRHFIFNFADRGDHDAAFTKWPAKPNMPYATWHGLLTAGDILKVLDKNYARLTKDNQTQKRALAAADIYLRKTVAKKYQYNSTYNFQTRMAFVEKFARLRDEMSVLYEQTTDKSAQMRDLFQVEQKGIPQEKGYWPCGFELEFYVPEQLGDYNKLIEYLKSKNGWQKLYSSNHDASVYKDSRSAGVIMHDESLVRYAKLAAVEYASSIIRDQKSEESCLKILDSFEQGHVNVHCSLHQHLASDGLDMDAYKRLVKRMMQHEEEIVSAFAAPERSDNKLIYATYISRNLSRDNKRDYPFLCVMVDLCEDKNQLREFASFGNKYKTLNLMPEHTVEMRYMNANFNKKFAKAFLRFNREFVQAAALNSPIHLNRVALNKYSWHNNTMSDNKTVIHPLHYFYSHEYDSFVPIKRPVSKEVIKQEQTYWRCTAHALNETGKLRPFNAGYYKKVTEAKNNVR